MYYKHLLPFEQPYPLTGYCRGGYDLCVYSIVFASILAGLLNMALVFAPELGVDSAAPALAAASGAYEDAQVGPNQGRRSKPATGDRLRARDLPQVLEQVKTSLAAGDTEKAEKLVDRARAVFESNRPSIKSEEIADWRLFDAKIQLTCKQYAAAGLAAMKVVILQHDSPRVAEALCIAGDAYDGLGRTEKAAGLFRECLGKKQLDPNVRHRAEAGLDRLKARVQTK